MAENHSLTYDYHRLASIATSKYDNILQERVISDVPDGREHNEKPVALPLESETEDGAPSCKICKDMNIKFLKHGWGASLIPKEDLIEAVASGCIPYSIIHHGLCKVLPGLGTIEEGSRLPSFLSISAGFDFPLKVTLVEGNSPRGMKRTLEFDFYTMLGKLHPAFLPDSLQDRLESISKWLLASLVKSIFFLSLLTYVIGESRHWQAFGEGMQVPKNTPDGLHFGHDWIQRCVSSHKTCRRPLSSKLPKRVVDVGIKENSWKTKVYEPQGKEGQYLCLSLC